MFNFTVFHKKNILDSADCSLKKAIYYILQARLNFPKYCEPITNKEANYSDVKKLWRNIEPHLRKAMSTVFLHEVSSSQWEQIQEGTHGVKGARRAFKALQKLNPRVHEKST